MGRGIASCWVLLLLLLAGPVSAQTKIALGYTAVTDYAASLIATDHGFFAKRGLDVQPVLVSLNSLEPAALVADSLQVAIPTVSIVLQSVDGGLDLVGLAGSSVTDPGNQNAAIIARTGSGIKTPQDLVGKRIGVPGLNALIHVLLREWLTLKGVDYRQVIFVEAPFPQMSDLLRNGTVDAVSSADPFTGRILAAQTGEIIGLLFKDLPPGIRTSLYAATRDWAKAHPEAIAAFQAGLVEAVQYNETHPDAWRPVAAKYFKLPPEAVANLEPPHFDLQVTPAQIDYWSEIMVKQGMIKSQIEPAKVLLPWQPSN